MVDVYLPSKRDGSAAMCFFRRLKINHHGEPRKIVTDMFRSNSVAHQEEIPDAIHITERYADNRADQSHEPTRVRERVMRYFKSMRKAQRFVTTHAALQNLFNPGIHLVRAQHYWKFWICAFEVWSHVVG